MLNSTHCHSYSPQAPLKKRTRRSVPPPHALTPLYEAPSGDEPGLLFASQSPFHHEGALTSACTRSGVTPNNRLTPNMTVARHAKRRLRGLMQIPFYPTVP